MVSLAGLRHEGAFAVSSFNFENSLKHYIIFSLVYRHVCIRSAVATANRRLGFYALHQAACMAEPGAKNRHFLALLKSICHN